MRRLFAAVLLLSVACGPSQEEVNARHLDEAAAEPGALRLESGMVFRELVAGTGVHPNGNDAVQVGYIGRFMDGEVFEQTAAGQTVSFGLWEVIPCWTEGVQHIAEQGQGRLTCPPDLAYGAQGSGRIPGNTVIQFDVSLINVVGQ